MRVKFLSGCEIKRQPGCTGECAYLVSWSMPSGRLEDVAVCGHCLQAGLSSQLVAEYVLVDPTGAPAVFERARVRIMVALRRTTNSESKWRRMARPRTSYCAQLAASACWDKVERCGLLAAWPRYIK